MSSTTPEGTLWCEPDYDIRTQVTWYNVVYQPTNGLDRIIFRDTQPKVVADYVNYFLKTRTNVAFKAIDYYEG